eukprot:4014418-Ditylum_brightwellii.AAC.1
MMNNNTFENHHQCIRLRLKVMRIKNPLKNDRQIKNQQDPKKRHIHEESEEEDFWDDDSNDEDS